MKVLQINTFYIHGSTGRIMYDLMTVMEANGISAYAAYGQDRAANIGVELPQNVIRLQGQKRRKLNILRTRLFDHHGFYNEHESKKLIRWMDEIRPDIIHLHNIHNHYVNVKMLFEYIKQKNIPVVWTLHDCWPFTGHCAYFDYTNCDKWKTGCNHCPSLKEYPPTWFLDRSRAQYEEKKALFNGVKSLTLVTPSEWLSNLCKQSFLSSYSVEVINNGIDTNVFKPSESNLRERLGIGSKKVYLAVSAFQKRKGIDFLIELPKHLKDDEILVWVGLSQEHIKLLPKEHCIGITKTDNIKQLAEYYSMADVFVNPTLEDNFPTTTIEAQCCGLPIVTFATGGSGEPVLSGKTNSDNGTTYTDFGAVVSDKRLEPLLTAIRKVCLKKVVNSAISDKGRRDYNKGSRYEQYIELYKRILEK